MTAAAPYSISNRARLLPPHPLCPRHRAGGPLAHGLRPAAAAPHRRPAVLAASGYRPWEHDDAERRPSSLGALRRLARPGRARRLPRTVARGASLARTERRSLPRP